LLIAQDAKSDRVKQLLKETEKYLQKLGSKLQEAKSMASRFENDMDESRTATVVEKNETAAENEDESDQAKAGCLAFSGFFCYFFGPILCYILLPYFFSHFMFVDLLCSITWKAMRSTI
jgi:hypothetical protein